jgi:hypothetical protein
MSISTTVACAGAGEAGFESATTNYRDGEVEVVWELVSVVFDCGSR